jgi:hypothetical protein
LGRDRLLPVEAEEGVLVIVVGMLVAAAMPLPTTSPTTMPRCPERSKKS